ncbi:cell lysis protein-like protein [Melanomma pulvis-pyrius CBS 109.77]|uniref:Reticulon-like protein n=1 Tax=Melanomma pulvis-pyrius CBS 109.77 TaxID=1314802 RepID=A0A6A6XVV6_9PLEO|nr:cell lysis protein-like protein [Melanomma pulvis-pyrius CBS 109.77]
MSEAPHLELNNSNLPDLDPSAPSNAGSYSNGSTKPQGTQNGILNFLSAARTPSSSLPNHLTAAAQSAQNAMAAVSNHPASQSLKDTVSNGPVAQNVKAEGAKTKNEFADLANARTTPAEPAATGQPLTHYHSLFYRLLSWKNPRATAISFAVSVAFIFAARYLNVIRYVFKAVYMTLGVTASAELGGKLAFGRGLTSQFRPRKYFTIPKASLERLLDDVEQFINFFVIESQRVVFAENVYVTGAAFFASLISYFLIKFVPLWGLTLIATTVAYIGPLVYVKNKEVIDAQLEKGYHLVNQQATQIKDLASQHTANAASTIQGYSKEYTSKAQETINSYRGRSASPEVKREFPAAPTHEPIPEKEPVLEPVL